MPALAVMPQAIPKPVQVRPFVDADSHRWDAFVTARDEGTFFHLTGWKSVLESVHRHKTHYLVAERGGKLCGVLPLAEVRSLLFGASLVSLPFCVYGGAVATDSDTEAALVEAACDLAGDLGVDHLELRNIQPCAKDLPTKSLYVTFRKAISAIDDENLMAIPRKQRAMIRKGEAAGLRGVVDANVDNLYACYSESLRNLGTPVFASRYLEALREVFPDNSEIVTILHNDAPVASVMSFFFRDTVLPYYGGGVAAARNCKANDYLYWEVMKRAVARGVTQFDYGRSKVDTGSYSFKKHWGFEPEPLHYQYFLVKAKQLPNLSPTNPKYRLLINTWKRLPVSLSRALGPLVARNLG